MKKTVSKSAKCPFYRYHTDRTIACEGMSSNAKLITVFESSDAARDVRVNFCNKIFGCEKCAVYIAVNRKYEE